MSSFDDDWFWSAVDETASPPDAGQQPAAQPSRVVRINPNGELADVYHLFQADETWLKQVGGFGGPKITVTKRTWCGYRYNDEDVTDYRNDMGQRPCGTCHSRMRAKAAPLASTIFTSGATGTKRTAALYRTFEREVGSVTEWTERELAAFDAQRTTGVVTTLIADTWRNSPATLRRRAQWQAEENERSAAAAEKAARRKLEQPTWVTTRARNYRHILIGGRFYDDGEKYKAIACPNQIMVHPCSAEELRLPVCPLCDQAQRDAVSHAELHPPGAAPIPEPSFLSKVRSRRPPAPSTVAQKKKE